MTPSAPPYSWSDDESARLSEDYQAGASLDELASRFGRSPHHVVVQLAWMMCGVGSDQQNPLAPRFREPWSEDEDRWLEAHYLAGRPITELARDLERDVTDVAWRLITERICDGRLSQAG